MAENWRACPDFVGLYEISDFGRVRSLYFEPPRACKLGSDSSGYPTVALSKNGARTTKTVHRLVCRAFHGEPYMIWNEAAHLNGDRGNARADNLKWVTKVENHFHQRAHGTHLTGERHGSAKLTAQQVREIRASSASGTVIARKYGITRKYVWQIRHRIYWKHSPSAG